MKIEELYLTDRMIFHISFDIFHFVISAESRTSDQEWDFSCKFTQADRGLCVPRRHPLPRDQLNLNKLLR